LLKLSLPFTSRCRQILFLLLVLQLLPCPSSLLHASPADTGGEQEETSAAEEEPEPQDESGEVDPDLEKLPSTFQRMNDKAEAFFKVWPVPIVYYGSETGTVLGLAKFNLFQLSKKDEISPPSKLEGIVTFSSEGQMALAGAATLNFAEDIWMYRGGFLYQDFPEYFFGIGNDVSVSDKEDLTLTNLTLDNQLLRRVGKHLYFGGVYNFHDYFEIEKEEGSALDREEITGRDGGISSGVGLTLIHDSRDNRYNASEGHFLHLSATTYKDFIGSDFEYDDYSLDARTYFVPWKDHILAFQFYTGLQHGDVPFYSLNKLGGQKRMRGWYEGALRDKAIIDAQVEYRMPIWLVFGVTGFVGAGRVAEDYSAMSFDDIHLSYGFGLRIMLDSENQTNLRIDFGFGPDYGEDDSPVRAFYINFAEAF